VNLVNRLLPAFLFGVALLPSGSAADQGRRFPFTVSMAPGVTGLAAVGGLGVRLNGEVVATRHVSVVPTAGFVDFLGYRVFGFGGQVRWYPYALPHGGVHVGLEALGVKGAEHGASGWTMGSIGPLLGYKHAFDKGLTLEAQGGLELAVISWGQATRGTEVLGFPVINLNVGWSFGAR
jgi:hypothetical protein